MFFLYEKYQFLALARSLVIKWNYKTEEHEMEFLFHFCISELSCSFQGKRSLESANWLTKQNTIIITRRVSPVPR